MEIPSDMILNFKETMGIQPLTSKIRSYKFLQAQIVIFSLNAKIYLLGTSRLNRKSGKIEVDRNRDLTKSSKIEETT